jgi:hypothetical protein
MTSEASQNAQSDRPIMPSVFLAVAVVIAAAVLLIDSSLTTEQRIAPFIQSGTFP